MSTYTGYFDESNDEHQPRFVLGGLILDVADIPSFNDAWNLAIRDLPGKFGSAHFLHMKDFISGEDIYRNSWKGRYDEKCKVLNDAAKVVHKYAKHVITCVMNMDDYASLDQAVKASETIGYPYALATRLTYQQLIVWSHYYAHDAPVQMVVEQRQGFAEVKHLFDFDGAPVPNEEPKGSPALQAADYIAWIRAKRVCPTAPYLAVKSSWSQINKFLCEDQIFAYSDYKFIWDNLNSKVFGALPLRDEDVEVVFNGKIANRRKQFKRKA